MTVDERFEWDQALFDLMYEGWTTNLADLLKTDRPIPPEIRHYLAALLEGKTKLPDGRGKKNTSLSPSDKEAVPYVERQPLGHLPQNCVAGRLA